MHPSYPNLAPVVKRAICASDPDRRLDALLAIADTALDPHASAADIAERVYDALAIIGTYVTDHGV